MASRALLVAIGLSMAASPAGAQQSGAGQGGDGRGVTMTVGPRWGSSIAGDWTTYNVSVRNGGDGALDADVVLIADDPAPSAVTPKAPAARWPSYRSHLSVFGGGETKTLTTVVLEAPYGYRAELREGSGALVASAPANAPRRGFRRYTVALLSATAGAGTTLEKTTGVFERQLVVTQLASPRDVPNKATDFIGLDAIVLDDFDTAGLAPNQLSALGDFVSLGGSLVVAGGAASARTVGALPAELAPLRPTGTQNSSLAPLGDLVSASTEASSTVTVGELKGGRAVLGAKDGPPLVVVPDQGGAGQVAQLAYDPLAEPLASDGVLRGVAFDQGLARVLPATGIAIQKPSLTPDNRLGPVAIGPAPGESSRRAPNSSPTRRLAVRSWPAPSLGVLVVYLAASVALGLFVLRARRPRPRAWLGSSAAIAVVAVVAVVATHPGVISVAGLTPRGERLLQIETLSPTGAVLVTRYEALAASKASIALPADAGASTVLVPAPLVGSGVQFDTNAVYDTGGGEIVRGPNVSELTRAGTKTPSLQTIAVDHGPPGLDSDLRRIGPDIPNGRVVGTVTNRGSRPLYRLRAELHVLNQPYQAPLAELLAPGATINVDAPAQGGGSVVFPARLPESRFFGSRPGPRRHHVRGRHSGEPPRRTIRPGGSCRPADGQGES